MSAASEMKNQEDQHEDDQENDMEEEEDETPYLRIEELAQMKRIVFLYSRYKDQQKVILWKITGKTILPCRG